MAEDGQSLFDIIRAHLTMLHGKVPVIEEVPALDDPEKWVPMTDLRVAERGVGWASRPPVWASRLNELPEWNERPRRKMRRSAGKMPTLPETTRT